METPAPAESAPVWRFLIKPRWLGWHALMVVPAAEETELPAGLGIRQAEQPGDDAEDEELARYNAYLARLNDEVKGHGKWRGLR